MDLNFYHNLKKAVERQCRGDDEKALMMFKVAARRKPDHPIVNMGLGTAYMNMQMYGHARRHFVKVLEKTGQLPAPFTNLCFVMKHLGEINGSLKVAQDGLELHPEDVALLVNAGSTAYTMGDLDLAADYLARALERDPESADALWNLGLVNLSSGNWDEGWKRYDKGFQAGPRHARPYWDDYPEWIDEPLEGKTILVWGEQGLGDEIMFASCLTDLIETKADVIFECHPRLVPVFKRSFPTITCVGTRKDRETEWVKQYDIDYQIPLGSLGGAFRLKENDFPADGYLKVDQARVDAYKKEIGGDFRLGISWRGGSKNDASFRRSMTLDELTDFIPSPWDGLSLVSLQYGDVGSEIAQHRALGGEIYHNAYALEDYDETFHMVAACDLVVSVITTIVHTAGSIDVPCWCLTPTAPPWKFLPGERMLWHPSVKQYHQKKPYLWDDVLMEVNVDLEKLK